MWGSGALRLPPTQRPYRCGAAGKPGAAAIAAYDVGQEWALGRAHARQGGLPVCLAVRCPSSSAGTHTCLPVAASAALPHAMLQAWPRPCRRRAARRLCLLALYPVCAADGHVRTTSPPAPQPTTCYPPATSPNLPHNHPHAVPHPHPFALQVIADNEAGLLFKNKRDRKVGGRAVRLGTARHLASCYWSELRRQGPPAVGMPSPLASRAGRPVPSRHCS